MITAALITQPIPIFFIVLAIIVLAPMLLNKLKIPHIIGMILAGVIVGPFGFKILDNDSSFAIFGQVGLLYLMFLAGLEIDMYHLRLNLRRGLLFGALTLIVPLALGVFTSLWIFHLDWVTSMLLGAMYASHTLISYPVAARYGITKSPAVLISIVGTIIAVVGALLILAAAVNVHREGAFNTMEMSALLLRLGLYTAGTLIIIPKTTRLFFRYYGDKVMQYVYVLAMMLLSAWVAQLIGLEPVLGAFLAGLVLNRFVPAASPLMTSIEFVGNAIFIPYFLISVGMMINLQVVFQGDTLITSAIMLSVALAAKWVPAYIAQKAGGFTAAGRTVMFGLTTAHTAVALAVVTLGYNLGLLDHTILNATVLVILVTCAAAPIITAAAAPKLKIQMLNGEEDGEGLIKRTRVNNTLIPVAQAMTATALVELAVLMRNDRAQHSIFALHVRNENTPAARAVSRSSLEEARKVAAAADVEIQTLERYDLNTVTGVLNAIAERDITEVILGMHRRVTVIDSFFGAKVEQLLLQTNKMILITRLFIPLNTVRRIVVAVPPKAQYETGFSRWVRAIARLTRQLGCRVIFCCTDHVQLLIRGVIYQGNYGIRCEFQTITSLSEDIILLSNRVLDDDLFIIIGARNNSVSYSAEMVEIPGFLQRHFACNNLIYIYPEQFGEETPLTSFTDPLAHNVSQAPSPLWLKTKAILRKILR